MEGQSSSPPYWTVSNQPALTVSDAGLLKGLLIELIEQETGLPDRAENELDMAAAKGIKRGKDILHLHRIRKFGENEWTKKILCISQRH